MREQTDARLKITSQTLTPQQIETQVGLKPDEAWRIGDRIGAFGSAAREHGFVIESGAQPSASFSDYLSGLIRKLAPAAQRIGSLVGQCDIEVVCTLHRKAGPQLSIERDDVRWIGVMGARLRLDTFILSEAPHGAAKSGGAGVEAPKF